VKAINAPLWLASGVQLAVIRFVPKWLQLILSLAPLLQTPF
jgi:hypothetical protein